MYNFYVKITHNSSGKIISLYSPDFDLELLDESINTENNFDFRKYIKENIKKHVLNINYHSNPKSRKELKNIPLTDLQHWEIVKIEERPGIFSKILPKLGHGFNVVTILTNAFITFMALRIASNTEDDSTKSVVFSIFGTIFSAFILFFLYVMSGASKTLKKIGLKIDSYRFKDTITEIKSIQSIEFPTRSSVASVSISLAAGGCMLGNSIISSITSYQQGILLTEKFLDLESDLSAEEKLLYYELIKWLIIIVNIVARNYCELAFQGSFAASLVQTITSKFRNKIEVNKIVNLEPPTIADQEKEQLLISEKEEENSLDFKLS